MFFPFHNGGGWTFQPLKIFSVVATRGGDILADTLTAFLMPTVFKRGESRVAMTTTRGTRRPNVGFDVTTDFCRAFPTLTFLGSFLP